MQAISIFGDKSIRTSRYRVFRSQMSFSQRLKITENPNLHIQNTPRYYYQKASPFWLVSIESIDLKVLIFQNLILKFFLLIIFCWINGELLFAPVCILCSIKRDHNKTTKKHTQKNSCNVQLNSYFIRTYGINFSSLR